MIEMYILTCPARKESLALTLAALKETDWGEEPTIMLDRIEGGSPTQQMINNSMRLLERGRDGSAEYILFIEDDVIFNRHLRHNLENWFPLKYGVCLVGTLYEGANLPATCRNFREVHPGAIGGSQAIVIKRDWIPSILAQWNKYPNFTLQDLRIYRSLLGTQQKLFCHSPNLVQHRPEVSTWGGGKHTSPTFDLNWRA